MPVLTVAGAGVRHRRRWLFRDLDVTAEPGDVVAVVGAPGSGRTTVLLALARRLRLSAGTIELSGRAALGYVPDVEQPEPVLTVAEHVRERLALLGRPARDAAGVLADGLYGLDPTLKGWQLTPYQKQLLGLALARLADPAVVALDGVDAGLDAAEQAELWRILGELSGAGVAVCVTARDVDTDRVATVVRLGDPQAAVEQAQPDRPAAVEQAQPDRPTAATDAEAAAGDSESDAGAAGGEEQTEPLPAAEPVGAAEGKQR